VASRQAGDPDRVRFAVVTYPRRPPRPDLPARITAVHDVSDVSDTVRPGWGAVTAVAVAATVTAAAVLAHAPANAATAE
jgi:hypothetical protein